MFSDRPSSLSFFLHIPKSTHCPRTTTWLTVTIVGRGKLLVENHTSLTTVTHLAFRNISTAQQPTDIDSRSRGFPTTLARMLTPQESVNAAISLHRGDASTVVAILDRMKGSLEAKEAQEIADLIDLVRQLQTKQVS